MTFDSRSDVQAVLERAERGVLNAEGFDRLLAYFEEAPEEHTGTAIEAVTAAVASDPTERLEPARPLLYAFLRSSLEIEDDTVRFQILDIAIELASVMEVDDDRIDEAYLDLLETLGRADGLESRLLSSTLAVPVYQSDDVAIPAPDLGVRYLETCRDVLRTVDYDRLPGPLGIVLGALEAAAETTDDPAFVATAVEEVDLLQAICHTERPVRMAGLELVLELARIDPDPLRPYVHTLVERLDRPSVDDAPGTTSGSSVGDAPSEPAFETDEPARRQLLLSILVELGAAHSDLVAPAATILPDLVGNVEPSVRLAALELATVTAAAGHDTGLEDPASDLGAVVTGTVDEERWFAAVTAALRRLVESDADGTGRLADALSEGFVDVLASDADTASGPLEGSDVIESVVVSLNAATAPVVEHLLDRRAAADPDETEMYGFMLALGVCTRPSVLNRIDGVRDELLDVLAAHGPAAVASDQLDRPAVESAVRRLRDDGTVPDELLTELAAAEQDAAE